MAAFVLFFVIAYGAMHALVYQHLRRLWIGHNPISYLVMGFMVMMVLTPLGIRMLETKGFPMLAQGLAYVAYIWMGFVFLSFCGFAAVSALGLLQRLLGLVVRFPAVDLGSRVITLAMLIAVVVTCCYGALEAWNIRVERIRVETDRLPAEVPRLTIAQISDVHLGVMVGPARLDRILAEVRAAAPDLLVSTGDLVDGQLGHMNGLVGLLDGIRPRFGKYAITGNHEFYAGLDAALEFTRRAGFTVLRDAIGGSAGPICIVGVDYRFRGAADGDLPLLTAADHQRFVLFLKHTPVVRPDTLGLFDLQLSGHTHRGQIFPFSLVTGAIYRMQAGFYPLDRGSHLYTSRGSGTWGPPIRVGSPPEVTIIELVRTAGS